MNQGFDSIVWWNSLRHSGLLLDRKRLAALYPADSSAISCETVDGLRRTLELGHSQTKGSSLELIDFVLTVVCGLPGLTGLRRNHPPVDWHVPKGRPVPGCPHDRVTVRAHNARVTGASLAPQPSPTFCHADPVAKHGINRWV